MEIRWCEQEDGLYVNAVDIRNGLVYSGQQEVLENLISMIKQKNNV